MLAQDLTFVPRGSTRRYASEAMAESKRIDLFNRSRIITSVVAGIVFAAAVAFTTWREPVGDPTATIQRIERILEDVRRTNTPNAEGKIDGNVFDQLAPWVELEQQALLLTPSNTERAKAKALVYFDQNLDSHSSYAWDHRFGLSKEPFQTIDVGARLARTFGFSILGLCVSTLLFWLLLVLLSWFWYFFLDRVSELSDAFRGKRGHDA